jgi:hypothetical protein
LFYRFLGVSTQCFAAMGVQKPRGGRKTKREKDVHLRQLAKKSTHVRHVRHFFFFLFFLLLRFWAFLGDSARGVRKHGICV